MPQIPGLPGVRTMVHGGTLLKPLIVSLGDGNTVHYSDVTEPKTVIKNEANLVSALVDYFNSGHDILQSTDTNKPILTISGLSFDGVNDFMQSLPFTIPLPFTVYLLVRLEFWATQRCLLGLKSSLYNIAQYGSSPNLIITTNGGANLLNNNSLPLNEFGVIKAVFNGASSSIQINNLTPTLGNTGSNVLEGISLGNYLTIIADRYAKFTQKALIIRTGVDSDLKQLDIYTKLSAKHNLTLNTARLIAISGQSNAIGYYPDDSVLPVDYVGDQIKIKILNPEITGMNFQLMNPAINSGFDWVANPHDNTGFGAEQSASHDLQTATNQDVLVVKTGFNGGAISEWDAGKAPYTNLEAGLIKALDNNDALVKYKNLKTLSLLWVQGESDAIAVQTTVYYEAKMRSLISRLRASDARLANLQVVMLKLSDLMTGFALDATKKGNVNTAFTNIVANTTGTLVLNPDVISGIALRSDNLHYTSASLLKIGTAWKALMPA